MPVLVYVENSDGQFKKSAFEVVSYAKALADQLNTALIALSIGNAAANALAELGKYGPEKILSVKKPKLEAFDSKPYASVLAQAANKENADTVILSNTFNGKSIAPALSILLNAGLVTAAIDLPKTESGKFTVRRTAFSGKAYADVDILGEKKVITLNPNSWPLAELGASVPAEAFEPELNDADFKISVRETIKVTDKVPLPEAEIVVSGGRGLKGPENWHLIEDLARELGGAVACSKPVSDAGWRPHEEHVGQTGIAISPNLYIAVGISGAIQHLAGVNSSKIIVAVNKDSDAPLFKAADYGIVGDAFEVVPKLIEAVKEFKAKG